ncbi:MAG: DUF1553 domain-containing protein [Gemmataceae bacterium]
MIPLWLIAGLVTGTDPVTPHFATEIIPILTKAGCNSGACHGATAGRGGFHLSLLGADPDADFDAIVQAYKGRRIHLAKPGESLLLKKPTGHIQHGGDVALPPDGAGAALLERWIAGGAPKGSARGLSRFEVVTDSPLVAQPDQQATARAWATFNDGPRVDVTAWTVFTPGDPGSVTVTDGMEPGEPGRFTVHRPGRHTVTARFLDRVTPITLTLPIGKDLVDPKRLPADHWIDEEINDTLALLRLEPAPPAEEAVFLRRLSLVLTGTLPTPDETASYLGDGSPDKKTRRIYQLLNSEAFQDYWTLKYARWLSLRSQPRDQGEMAAYTGWLRESLRGEKPMGLVRLARELVTATGDTRKVGPANFARQSPDARGQAELAGRAFLGVQLGCANCHNHPLDRWTQDDYHGLAAVFAKLDRGPVVRVAPRGEVTNPRTGSPAIPRLPGTRFIPGAGDPRQELSDWMVHPDNPLFAKAQVNRLWKSMFGRGLVEPVDDLRDTNPASHPHLLDRLATDFRDHGYNLKHLLGQIALTRAFGRSASFAPEGLAHGMFYTHYIPHTPEPEVLADAFSQVLGVADEYPGKPARTRAITLWDPLSPSPSLDSLGRCQRGVPCQEGTAGGGLPARLHLLNGALLNQRLGAADSRLGRLIAGGKSNPEIIAEFYQAALGKKPTQQESKTWERRLGSENSPADRRAALEDFVWALVNSKAFTTVH